MNIKTQLLPLILFSLLLGCKPTVKEQTNPIVDFSSISSVLDSINTEDQKYRAEIDSIAKEYGMQSQEMMSHWNKINQVDSSNLVLVEEILEQHGWLSTEQIGKKANRTLFLVIQHADQKTQEKYLPMMRQAVKVGNASSKSLALLEDRVLLRKGELQLYGSQIGRDQETGEMYVLPLFDPEKVNERRAEVGLGTIEDYISRWKIEWDVEEYKKKLPAWIEYQKKQQTSK